MSQRHPPFCHSSSWFPVLCREARSTWEYPWRPGLAQQSPACTSPGRDLEEDEEDSSRLWGLLDWPEHTKEEEEGAEEEEEQEQDEGGRSEAAQTCSSRRPPWKPHLQPCRKRRSPPWLEDDDSACTSPEQEDAKIVRLRPRKLRRYPPREVENDSGCTLPEKHHDSACTSSEQQDEQRQSSAVASLEKLPQGHRMLVAEMDVSLGLEALMDLADEDRIGLIILTGDDNLNEIANEATHYYFPGWGVFAHIKSAGALVLWDPDYWCVKEVRDIHIFTELPHHDVITFELRRSEGRSLAPCGTCALPHSEGDHEGDHVLVMVTAFRDEAAEIFCRPPDEDKKKRSLEVMLQTAERVSPGKWLIAGSTECFSPWKMKKILQRGAPHIDPVRLTNHRQYALGCIASGVQLASLQPEVDEARFVVEMQWLAMPRVEASTVCLRPLHDCLMRALENIEAEGVQSLAPLVYGTCLPHVWSKDGSLMLESSTQAKCERRLEFALGMLRTARKHGRQTANGTWMEDSNTLDQDEAFDEVTLSDIEMDNTVAWCRAEFEKNYMTVKRRRSNSIRGAFRTFLKNLIGDASIGYGIMRHGCFTTHSLRKLILEVKEKKEERAQTSSHRGITCEAPPQVRDSKLWRLGQEAKAAREAFARGRKLAFAVERGNRTYSSLNKHEEELHGKFHRGILEGNLIEANTKYGMYAIEASKGNEVDLDKPWAEGT